MKADQVYHIQLSQDLQLIKKTHIHTDNQTSFQNMKKKLSLMSLLWCLLHISLEQYCQKNVIKRGEVQKNIKDWAKEGGLPIEREFILSAH